MLLKTGAKSVAITLLWFSIVFCFVFSASLKAGKFSFFTTGPDTTSLKIIVRALVPEDDRFQLFFSAGTVFSEPNSIALPVKKSGNFQSLIFKIPNENGPLRKIRFHSGETLHPVTVQSISLIKGESVFTLDANDIHK